MSPKQPLRELYLLDLDGLLIDTEKLHYQAYREMCRHHGGHLPWSFEQYAAVSQSAQSLEIAILTAVPQLQRGGLSWYQLYQHKQDIVRSLIARGNIGWMPGAENLLRWLDTHGAVRCVVTNSSQLLVPLLQDQCPLLKTIPKWFTREMYLESKPAPDGYLTALRWHGIDPKGALGFEDSLKGMRSLCAAKVEGVWVQEPSIRPEQKEALKGSVHWSHCSTLIGWLEKGDATKCDQK